MMKYKGYVAVPQYSANDQCFFGKLLGIKDIIVFEGTTVKQLEKAFHDAVNDYVDTCEEMGKAPQKPVSSKLHVRMAPELHAKIVEAAGEQGKSVNQYVVETLEHTTI